MTTSHNKNSGQLMRYKGLSNIPDDRGRTQVVTIVYDYSSHKR
jgi:hypothetical protein